MGSMTALLWIAVVAAAIYGLHRVALWAESRGWIFYVKRKPDPASVGAAALELEQLARPQQKHVLEVRRRARMQGEAAGDPPPR